ncbi:MAG: transposase, partial [Actinomycetota bacterium]|nr:transposase [Actinomycetota bacterium]
RILARLPLLHPEGLDPVSGPSPADPFRRAVRRRSKLVRARTVAFSRLDALIELLGPAFAEVLGGGGYTKTALVVLERFADPRELKRFGLRRLTELLVTTSVGAWRGAKAEELLAAADQSLALWSGGGLDFAELAADIAGEIRAVGAMNAEIDLLDGRIAALFAAADRQAVSGDGEIDDGSGIVASVPGLEGVLGAGILARFGDFDRFANLAGVGSFTGLVPKIDQSGTNADGHGGPTTAGDPGLRQALYLAADKLRKVDPTFAQRYYRLVVDEGKHHNSALCHLAANLATRIAACWRRHQRYVLLDTNGNEITQAEGRAIIASDSRSGTTSAKPAAITRRPSNSNNAAGATPTSQPRPLPPRTQRRPTPAPSNGRAGAVRSRPKPLRPPARPPQRLPRRREHRTRRHRHARLPGVCHTVPTRGPSTLLLEHLPAGRVATPAGRADGSGRGQNRHRVPMPGLRYPLPRRPALR